jgi:transposase, IS5 family
VTNPEARSHRRAFRHEPELYDADRGFFSDQNLTACVQAPTLQRQAYERAAAFKHGRHFRAGIDRRISVLMPGGMKRCRAQDVERFTLFAGAAALANNLMIVAGPLTKHSLRQSRAARAVARTALANLPKPWLA